jgi:hypothetical protein
MQVARRYLAVDRNIIDLYENLKCELNYFNYNFTRLHIRYYEKFSRIQQRIQKSINKQTEYENLVLMYCSLFRNFTFCFY